MRTSGIFPIPIGIGSIERAFTKLELNSIKSLKKDATVNEFGFLSSDNKYLFDEQEFTDLHSACLSNVISYLESFNSPSNDDVEIYITQSWVNFINKGEAIPPHNYLNSYVSGILFVNAEAGQNDLYFVNPIKHFLLNYIPKEWNPYNSTQWFFPVKTGDIVLFPSSLSHFFKPLLNSNERISISFNTFIKGKFGSKNNFTEIML